MGVHGTQGKFAQRSGVGNGTGPHDRHGDGHGDRHGDCHGRGAQQSPLGRDERDFAVVRCLGNTIDKLFTETNANGRAARQDAGC